MTWGRVIRWRGSLRSMREMRSLSLADTAGLCGKVMACARMTLYNPMMLGSLKGTVPALEDYIVKAMCHSDTTTDEVTIVSAEQCTFVSCTAMLNIIVKRTINRAQHSCHTSTKQA